MRQIINKILCKIFGHEWEHYQDGIIYLPSLEKSWLCERRVCLLCSTDEFVKEIDNFLKSEIIDKVDD